MILTNNILKNKLNKYSNKNTKIAREIKNGKLIKIKNGLYETDETTNGYLLAGSIYGPSYLSFGLCIILLWINTRKGNYIYKCYFNKRKKKMFSNKFGTFLYRDVPEKVYPLGINLLKKNNYYYQIATPEKALCDKLYTLSPLKNLEILEKTLLNDLRIDIEELKKLNMKSIKEFADAYHSTNVNLLYKFIRRIINE